MLFWMGINRDLLKLRETDGEVWLGVDDQTLIRDQKPDPSGRILICEE